MAILKCYWNFIESKHLFDVSMHSRAQAAVTKVSKIAPGCRGIFFRSVLSQEQDPSAYLNEAKLEDLRKARTLTGNPRSIRIENQDEETESNGLLYKPKSEEEKSIATLRIVRPKRFEKIAPHIPTLGNKNPMVVTLDDKRVTQFEVLLESTEFILEEVQEQMAERFQLQETFGDFHVFFFGKRAEIFTYSGSLINACGNLQWRNQFLDDYDKFLRGTKCAELKARAYILYDDVMREGFILSASLAQNSTVEGVVKFTFTMLITGKRTLGEIPQVRTPVTVPVPVKDNQFGINEFRFYRSIDPDLPGVYRVIENRDSTGRVTSSDKSPSELSLLQLDTLPDSEPPGDLKQIMINESITAIQKIQGEGTISETGETIDHDVLVDFITKDELHLKAATTSSIISGKRALDIDGLEGKELVSFLVSGNIAVDQLRLHQAVKAANSFITDFPSSAGADLIGTLSDVTKFFSAANRAPSLPTADSESLKNLKTNGKYVLATPLDNNLLNSLVSDTEILRAFKADIASKEAIDSLTVSSLNVLLQDRNSLKLVDIIKFYVASFTVIKDPSTQALFSTVSTNFPSADTLAGTDGLKFVEQQKISALAKVVSEIVTPVESKFSQALDSFKGSELATQISSALGVSKDGIPLDENIAQQSFTSSLGGVKANVALMGYLNAVSVYVTGITTELEGTVRRVSTDTIAATVRMSASKDGVGGSYFIPGFASELEQFGGSRRTGVVSFKPVVTSASQPVELGAITVPFTGGTNVTQTPISTFIKKGAGGIDYLVLPLGVDVDILSGSSSATIFAASAPAAGDFVSPVLTIANIGAITGPLAKAGIIQMSAETSQALQALRNPTIYFYGGHREAKVLFRGHTETATPDALNIRDRQGTARFVGISTGDTQSFHVSSPFLVASRSYLAGRAITFTPPTPATLLESLTAIGRVVQSGMSRVADDARRKAEAVITGTKTLTDAEITPIKKQLPLSIFAPTSDVAKADTALKLLGVTTDNYLDLATGVQIEANVAVKLQELKDLLAKAVANAQGTSGDRGAQVDKNDVAAREHVCG